MKQKLILFFSVLIGVISCTKDDICEEGIPTTPLLVVEFRDANNETQAKAVENLKVRLTDTDNTEIFVESSADTLFYLPLNTEATFTEYQLVANSTSEANMNTDLITFTYTREDIYVNRACAFKVVFNDLGVNLEGDDDNWIESISILNNTVEDEIEAHITIFH